MSRARAIVAVGAMLFLVGCSVVQGPARPTFRVFALEAEAEPAASERARSASATAAGGVIVVGLPQSGPGYATNGMAYSRGDREIEYYAAHRWADTPARMIAPLLQEALMATGAFEAVATMPTRVLGDAVLESEVLAFRQELSGDSPHFRASLRVTFISPGRGGRTGSRTLRVTEPLEDSGPVAGVAAANRAVARLVREAAEFCVEMEVQQ